MLRDDCLGIIRNNIVLVLLLSIIYISLEFILPDTSISLSINIFFTTIVLSLLIYSYLLIKFKFFENFLESLNYIFFSFLIIILFGLFYYKLFGLILLFVFVVSIFLFSLFLTYLLSKKKWK